MWSWKESDSSNITPRFLTVWEKVIFESSSFIELVIDLQWETEEGVPISITSDLEWFYFRKLSESRLDMIE